MGTPDRHPIDLELRSRLRALFDEGGHGTQTEFARRAGVNQSWLNKFANGQGHASIDQAIRIIAVLIGLREAGVGEPEARLLRVWQRIPPEDAEFQDAAIAMIEEFVKRSPHARKPESVSPKARTPAGAKHTARGIR